MHKLIILYFLTRFIFCSVEIYSNSTNTLCIKYQSNKKSLSEYFIDKDSSQLFNLDSNYSCFRKWCGVITDNVGILTHYNYSVISLGNNDTLFCKNNEEKGGDIKSIILIVSSVVGCFTILVLFTYRIICRNRLEPYYENGLLGTVRNSFFRKKEKKDIMKYFPRTEIKSCKDIYYLEDSLEDSPRNTDIKLLKNMSPSLHELASFNDSTSTGKQASNKEDVISISSC